MALLQISEPGLSAAPHQRRLAAGIDLGTTNSLVATVRSGQAETLPDHQGRYLLPSVVNYHASGLTVGYDARLNAAQDPANTISSVKRMMGRSLADIQNRYPHLPYQLQASENGLPMIQTAAWPAEPDSRLRRHPESAGCPGNRSAGWRTRRRGDHRSRLFRRRSASGDQRRGASGGAARAAPAQ